MTSAASIRDSNRLAMRRAILDAAWAQIAAVGADGLSLRAIARDLAMASSAIYRHVESRDALLTLLIVEGYNELGQHVETAEAAIARDDHARRFGSVCHAVRAWALANPHRYALLYGSPVPGYAAPDDTIEPATRTTRVLAAIVVEMAAGRTRRPRGNLAAFAPMMAEHFLRGLDADEIAAAMGVWAQLFGLVSFEVFGQFHGVVVDNDAVFEVSVREMTDRILGITSSRS